MRVLSRFAGFGQDLKYALRFFCRRPVMTASAFLTLSFGIGLNTAIFAFAYNVLWRELSLPESDRLVYLAEVGPPPLRERTRVSAPNAADWAKSAATLDALPGRCVRSKTAPEAIPSAEAGIRHRRVDRQ